MKKKIALIEYLNYVAIDGTPIGHGKKVLSQMTNLLADNFIVNCIASRAYMNAEIQKENTNIKEISQADKTIKEINQAVFLNLKNSVQRISDEDIIWFTNSDWHLFAYLPFLRIKKKIIVTVYRDIRKDVEASKSKLAAIKKMLVERGINKVDLFIISNRNLHMTTKQIYVPDYIYDEKYRDYINENKIDRILCVGAMRKSKDLEGVIRRYRDTVVPIYIVGKFQDKQWYFQLKELSTSNIIIEDRVISYDEYYKLIGESRFTILPYDMDVYETATSGILQEAVFLGSIPIAPQTLLQNNGINGIGYESLSELSQKLPELIEEGKNIWNSLEEYDESKIRNKIRESLMELTETK